MLEVMGVLGGGGKGENKWDNSNSIINKIYFKNMPSKCKGKKKLG